MNNLVALNIIICDILTNSTIFFVHFSTCQIFRRAAASVPLRPATPSAPHRYEKFSAAKISAFSGRDKCFITRSAATSAPPSARFSSSAFDHIMLLLPYSALPESLPPFRPSSRIAVRISCRSPRCQARIPAVNINKTGSPSSSLHKQTHHRIISITAGQPKQPEKPRQLPSLRSLGNIKKKLTSEPIWP